MTGQRRMARSLIQLLRAARMEQSVAQHRTVSAALPALLSAVPSVLDTVKGSISVARGFSTSKSLNMSSALSAALEEEIKYERDHYTKPEGISQGPPAPFTLSEAPGDTMLTLTRSYANGAEQISVDLHVNNQPAAEEDDEDELSTVLFNVHVTKGDKSLVFECESDGTFVAIDHVSYEPMGGSDSESVYTGPVFDELEENLQEEFRKFLSERGITPELGEYLRHLVFDKEMREYTNWLQGVFDFVKK